MLDRPRVRAALAYFHRFDGTRLPFRRILDNLLAVARDRVKVYTLARRPADARVEVYGAA